MVCSNIQYRKLDSIDVSLQVMGHCVDRFLYVRRALKSRFSVGFHYHTLIQLLIFEAPLHAPHDSHELQHRKSQLQIWSVPAHVDPGGAGTAAALSGAALNFWIGEVGAAFPGWLQLKLIKTTNSAKARNDVVDIVDFLLRAQS